MRRRHAPSWPFPPEAGARVHHHPAVLGWPKIGVLSMTSAISGTIAAHLADLATFGLAIGFYGVGGEANPFARELFAIGGIGLVAALKVLGALAAALIVSRRPGWLWLASGSGLIGAITGIVAVLGSA